MNEATVAVFHGPGEPFEMLQRELPDVLRTREVLVRLELATICGSDLHTWQGRRKTPVPCVLGHEAVGRVMAVGERRSTDWIGQRVTWTMIDNCGACQPCRVYDLPQKCESLFKYGHAPLDDAHGLNGCYATHIVLRSGTQLVSIPDEVDNRAATPANCALATMIAATETLPNPCKKVVIQGAGMLGLYGAALLKSRGVAEVLIVDPVESRLELVSRFRGEPLPTHALPAHDGTVDLVIEAAGVPSVFPEGLKLLRPGGHYVLVGMVHSESDLRVTGESLIRGCVTVRGVHNYRERHLEGAVRFLKKNRQLPWSEVISPPFPLRELDKAFESAGERRWPRVCVLLNEDSEA